MPLSPTHVSTILETFGCQQLTRLDLFDVGYDPPPSQTLSQIVSTFPTLKSLTLLSDEHLGSWPGHLVSIHPSIESPWRDAWRGETDRIFARQNDCVRTLQSLSSLRYLCWNNIYEWEPRADLDVQTVDDRNTWLYNTADPLALSIPSLQEIKFVDVWTRFCKSCIITRFPKPSIEIVEGSLDFLYPNWLVNQHI